LDVLNISLDLLGLFTNGVSSLLYVETVETSTSTPATLGLGLGLGLTLTLTLTPDLECSLPPPKKEVMFSLRSVCLFVCLSVCPSDNSKSCEQLLTKFLGGVGHGPWTKEIKFGDEPDHRLDPGVRYPDSLDYRKST